jgi:predicted DNA-binding transcriptional regulator AlpA
MKRKHPRLFTAKGVAVEQDQQFDHTAALAIQQLLTIDDIAAALQCTRRHIDKLRASGGFPSPDLKVGRRFPRWRQSTISAWIDRQSTEGPRPC